MKFLITLPLLLAAHAALADDAAILRCRALGETGARLACYDAIPVARAGAPAPVAAVPAAPAPAAAAPAAPAVAAPEARFGLAPARRVEAEQPRSIESSIVGKFEGWGPNSQFTLANGQVWRVADGSTADLSPMNDPKVRIVRNLFGTMFLEIDGSNNSPKVRRVR